jgi:hypothetical protein
MWDKNGVCFGTCTLPGVAFSFNSASSRYRYLSVFVSAAVVLGLHGSALQPGPLPLHSGGFSLFALSSSLVQIAVSVGKACAVSCFASRIAASFFVFGGSLRRFWSLLFWSLEAFPGGQCSTSDLQGGFVVKRRTSPCLYPTLSLGVRCILHDYPSRIISIISSRTMND